MQGEGQPSALRDREREREREGGVGRENAVSVKLTLGSAGQTCCAVSSQQYTWSTCHSGSRSSTPPTTAGKAWSAGS